MILTFEMEDGSRVPVECAQGENVLSLAKKAGVALDAPCSGSGSCGKCRVRLLSGSLVSTPSRHISREDFEAGWRLGCCSTVSSDAVVLVPKSASAYVSGLRITDTPGEEVSAWLRKLKASGINMDNSFLYRTVELPEPTLDDHRPDNERLESALCRSLGVGEIKLSFSVLGKLARVLRENRFRVCVKGYLEGDTFRCMEVSEPADTLCAGCAIDIGTTTVSALLMDLCSGAPLAQASCGNAQIRFGSDVISRIMEQGKPGGRELLRKGILDETLVPLLTRLCGRVGIGRDSILRVTIGANTTMNHLLLGLDAQPIRLEPYVPSFFSLPQLRAGELGLPVNPDAPVRIAPNVGSYVGGDITAGALAAGLWQGQQLRLLVDLGTNGELVLGNEEFLMCCACSAGPAFEGGEISCGMRASEGAIEGCTIDPQTLEPTLRVIGKPGQKPVGICGSGLIDIIAQLLRHGAINGRGDFRGEYRRVRRDAHGVARYILAWPWESGTGREVSIDEVDIDCFIRAKGAIYSAIDTLLDSVGMPEEAVETVYVAGGIGSGISMDNAIAIGMLPNLPKDRFRFIGNSSLMGACAATLGDGAWEKLQSLAANMTYLELSACPGYMDAFVAASFLPHTDGARFERRDDL